MGLGKMQQDRGKGGISVILEMFLETQAMKLDDAGFDSCPATDWLCELGQVS